MNGIQQMAMNMALPYLIPIVIAMVAAAFVWGIKQANTHATTFIQGHLTGNSEVAALDLLNKVTGVAGLVVSRLQQTLVDPLKSASADGKLSPAEIAMLQTQSVSELKGMLGDGTLGKLSDYYGDVETLLKGAVESAVLQARSQFPVLNTANLLSAPVGPHTA